MTRLRAVGSLPQSDARFYIAQVALMLRYLHSKQIVYRDLKPENLLIDSNGYLRLVDFSFSKVITKRTFTLCGTPEYIAPEILKNDGHGFAVDWWALGILLYEMLTGITPFWAETPHEIY